MPAVTDRSTAALDHARIAHADQVRKGSTVHYLAHLLGVSSLVPDYGGDEDQAIAGLLHDVIEDCGARHEVEVRRRFGDRVTRIVLACIDGSAESKAASKTSEGSRHAWEQRKRSSWPTSTISTTTRCPSPVATS